MAIDSHGLHYRLTLVEWLHGAMGSYRPIHQNGPLHTSKRKRFYTNYGRHPETLNPQRTEVMNPAAYAYAHWIKGAFENGKIALEAARKRMSENTDNRRIYPPAYKIGDPVMLSTRHIKRKSHLGSWTTNTSAPSKSTKSSRPPRYD